MKKKVIAFVGPIGVGKSTATRYLTALFGGNARRISFADPLKEMLKTLGLSDEELYGSQKETPSDLLGGRTPRHAMQTLGTEWGRDMITSDLWVRAWMQRVENSLCPYIIVDDARFPNEDVALQKYSPTIIRLFRSGVENKEQHSSEQFDCFSPHRIIHAETVEELHEAIEMLFTGLR